MRELNVDGLEIINATFHPSAELPDLTIPRLANRIGHALEARSTSSVIYLENGCRLDR